MRETSRVFQVALRDSFPHILETERGKPVTV
jgi:hypothetical protein